MAQVNYENFILELIKPLVVYPDDVVVQTFSVEGDEITIQVMVNSEDLGRVIGKKGRVATAIRTIAYACAAKNGNKINISIDSF